MLQQEHMRHLTKEIRASVEARVAGIASLREETARRRQAARTQLRETDRACQAMARRQRADLSKGRATVTHGEARRKSHMRDLMKVVASSHQAMARQQRAALSKGRGALAQGDAQRKARVRAWLNEVASDHAGAREEWRDLTSTSRSERAGAVAVAEAPAAASEEAPQLARAETARKLPWMRKKAHRGPGAAK